VQRFAVQSETFLEKWAAARIEMPVDALGFLRELRHECRKQIGAVIGLGQGLGQLTGDEANSLHPVNMAVRDLLQSLDRFEEALAITRRAILGNDDPRSPAFEHLLDSRPRDPVELSRGTFLDDD
jgi:hypothetical protein